MMKKCFLLLAALPFFAQAQRLHLDVFGGVSNYQGDLQGKRVTFIGSYPAFGVGASYDLTSKLVLRGRISLGKVGGDDKKNSTAKGIEFRNLSFKSNITEFQTALEYNFLDLGERSLSPYVFAGAAIYHFNPFTSDPVGNKVFLRPLSTEGQGIEPGKKNYALTQFAIPFGGGVKWALGERTQISVEIGLRKLFTDYLDDVSTTYADEAALLAARGPKAVELAYRGDEVPGGPGYPAGGSQRGSSKYKDWYYFSGITASFTLGGNGSGGKGRAGKHGVGCPVLRP